MNGLRHKHIIEMKAIITWEGKGNYFMFQWADGGSLRDLYKRSPRPTLNAKFVKQVLRQLAGLSSALNELHNYKKHDKANGSYRHGDLKPENILRFSNGTEVGLLKISDLGLAKHHVYETGLRGPTVTRHGTPLYEPPEVILEPEIARSRQYDIWSMGCVLLELLVWLMYGYDELVRFNHSMNSALGNSSVYWVMEETDGQSRSAGVHPSVTICMDIMGKDLQRAGQTAISDLLRLIRYRLLVVALPRTTKSSSFGQSNSSIPAPAGCRAKASDLKRDMQDILDKAERDGKYASTNVQAYNLNGRIEAIKSGIIMPSQFSLNIPVFRRQEVSSSIFPQLTPTFHGSVVSVYLNRHDNLETLLKLEEGEELETESTEEDSASDFDEASVFSGKYTASSTSTLGSDVVPLVQELVNLIHRDDDMWTWITEGTAKPTIGHGRMEANFRRILQHCSQKLLAEAMDDMQKLVANFVKMHARKISQELLGRNLSQDRLPLEEFEIPPDVQDRTEKYLRSQQEALGASKESETTEPAADEESDNSGDDVPEDDPGVDNVVNDNDDDFEASFREHSEVQKAKDFITQSAAFQMMSRQIHDFVHPPMISELQRRLRKYLSAEGPSSAIRKSYGLPNLVRELHNIPPLAIRVEEDGDKTRHSTLDSVRWKIEKWSGESWDWWPMKPPKRPISNGHSRITWECVRSHTLQADLRSCLLTLTVKAMLC